MLDAHLLVDVINSASDARERDVIVPSHREEYKRFYGVHERKIAGAGQIENSLEISFDSRQAPIVERGMPICWAALEISYRGSKIAALSLFASRHSFVASEFSVSAASLRVAAASHL